MGDYMEANMNYIKKQVQDMEELYDFIRKIANTDDVTLFEIYDTYELDDIILSNSLKELYDKWYTYRKKKLESNGWFLD